jgi:H+/Cl- antiporter ClcA
MHPIETGNIVLIVVGLVMIISGPWIIYNVVTGLVRVRRTDPQAEVQKVNMGTNLVIAVILFFAGILFVKNNLSGNPLHFKTQTQAESLVR